MDYPLKYVLCSGGIGDAIIGVAEAKRLNASLFHAANRFNARVVEEFISAFGVPNIVYDGNFIDNKGIFATLKESPNCVSTCHLPDNMEFVRWADRNTYEKRIPRKLDVQSLFGQKENFLPTKGIITIAPAGSNMPPIIETPMGRFVKNRVMNAMETEVLTRKFRDDHTVLIVGDHRHSEYVKVINHSNVYYMTSTQLLDKDLNVTTIDIKKMFGLINASKQVISVDTWLKTYSCYAGVPTTVLKTRYAPLTPDGKAGQWFYPYEQLDISENIFLNRNVWDLKEAAFEDVIK